MIFDTDVPVELKRIQEWFAGVITQPINLQSQIDPLAPSGQPIEIEAAEYIKASPTLLPHLRIQIYNQQYWWRLISILHETFPLLTCLLGYVEFNQTVGVPFLRKYPANHWLLHFLGDRLGQWIEEEYQGEKKQLILDCVKLDLAYNIAFYAKNFPLLDTENIANMLYLQPHVSLFQFSYDLLSFRKEVVKHKPDYWNQHPVPSLAKNDLSYPCVIYRGRTLELAGESISQVAYQILELFKNGIKIDNVCEWIDQQSPDFISEAEDNLHTWFQDWTIKGLLRA